MTKKAVAALVGSLGALLAGCGHRGDPLPPLRRTPPAPTELRLVQRAERMEFSARAPGASVDGLPLRALTIEFLYGTGQGDLEKTGSRASVGSEPGARVTQAIPLPAPGTSLRVVARAIADGDRSVKTLTLALVARPVVEAPRELSATLAGESVTLAWAGERPTPLPTPVAAPAPAAGPAAATAAPGTVAGTSGKVPDAAAEAKAARRTSGFVVYRRLGSEPYDAPLGEEPLERRRFSDDGVPLGSTACYVVRAARSMNPLIESAPSNEVCLDTRDVTAPERPAGLALLPRRGGLELLWSPSREPDLAGYRVYRASGGGAPARLAELPATDTSHLDTTAERGRAYSYSLTTLDRAGNESPPCEPVEATLP